MQEHKPIRKILVANRGEIAIRVFRAATELGLRTIAVYTYEDRYSLHRYKADEAYQIGRDDDPLQPYLNIEEIIETARRQGVDAIHPGYGFLAENVDFARRCAEEGIVFIGPRAEVMASLGDKMKAKAIAVAAGVPVIDSSEGDLSEAATAEAEAARIGYPVIVKAAAGGGGRGMRVAANDRELSEALGAARREAARAFGNDSVFLEKFVDDPKHVEVQIIADNYGTIYHLFERDCSVQRRFQKVVEIAPCVALQAATRERLYDYALRIARQVNYNNIGTVEFLVDREENIYFIEVNPRIQVEHTISEEITGVDIVRTQILMAQGHRLTEYINAQSEVICNGVAIQCRITTEDPANDFQPDYGRIVAYRHATGFRIRLDEGSSYQGVKISPFFDSMLVKVSASGRSLTGACQRLHRALMEFRIRGVKTNVAFLLNVISHPVFQAGQATVGFIARHPELLEFTPRRDRGTKLLRYVANVIVNGNPDVKRIDSRLKLRRPVVPDYDRFAPFPEGSRDRLRKLGRSGFIEWLRQEPAVQFTDTTMRDAHQSLLATRVRSHDMLQVAESFARRHPNVFSMEVWGGATFDVAMRFLHECPWRRLQQLRGAMPNLLLQMLIRGSNAVGYTAYPDNLIASFIERAGAEGVDIFRIFDSLNWLEAMKTSIRAVVERSEGLAEVCICYTGDISDPRRSKYTLDYYLDLAKRIEDEGAHILAIKDMAGLLKPYAAETLITALRKSLAIPIHLHTHDTSGIQAATYLKAIEAGVDVIDVALGSMSGLTSQPNFNSMTAMLEGHPREQAVDQASLNRFAQYWEDVRQMYYPFETELKAGTAEVYEHEIPGGQYSNLRPQARALGLEDQFETIKQNYRLVNKMFGDVIKVTPSSKVVGDMAMFMTSNGLTEQDIREGGDELSFPESVINYFKGYLGQPYGGFPPAIQQKILKGATALKERPNAALPAIDLEAEFAAFTRRFGREFGYLDFLSFKFYPRVFEEFAEQVINYGDVAPLPTTAFFYGMQPNEEIIVEIAPGKSIIIKFLYVGEARDDGRRTVYFELNGQTRGVDVHDNSFVSTKVAHRKADTSEDGEIGAPLPGKLAKVLVAAGDQVDKNQSLGIIEAMKMETTVAAPFAGRVAAVVLPEGSLVEQGDLLIELRA